MKILVTGSAGFIGFHLSSRLVRDGHSVLGYDGMTSYYDVALKRHRNDNLSAHPNYRFVEAMLEDRETLARTLADFAPDIVVHLAAQAGVRYSIEAPETYLSSNVAGTFNLLEALKDRGVRHLLFASSSSVYGGNESLPFTESERSDFPVSLYAATKKAGEALTHSYAHLYGIPTTCFRFFTVYGPAGRPDMALYKFVERIEAGLPIEIYGEDGMVRDATGVDDLVEAVIRLIDAVPRKGHPVLGDGVSDSLSPVAPWRTVNIAGGRPVALMDFIAAIEYALGKTAIRIARPRQKGDVVKTLADPGLLKALTGFVPQTPIDTIVAEFVAWYRQYHKAAPKGKDDHAVRA